MPGGRPRMNLEGQRFGRLVVQSPAGVDPRSNTLWLCLCDCGEQIVTRGGHLKSGTSRSCGCLARELSADRATVQMVGNQHATTHGHTPRGAMTPTYQSWTAMHQRCGNPNTFNYPNYGGRGIGVCQRWGTFENFLADMGERPDGKTLERVDNDGNYEPDNCRWATPWEQAQNRRPQVRGRTANLDVRQATGRPSSARP